MAITKEQVLARLKKLKKTYDDERIEWFVVEQIMPHSEKEAEEISETKIPKSRFDTVNTTMNDLKTEKTAWEKDKKRFEDAETKFKADLLKATEASKGKGEKWEDDLKKIQEDSAAEIQKIRDEGKLKDQKNRDRVKKSAESTTISKALEKAGCDKKLLDKALKLFDKSKVVVEFTNEDELEYETETDANYLDEFKTDNPFLFKEPEEVGEDGKPIPKDEKKIDWISKSKPVKGQSAEETQKATILKKFTALGNTVDK